jgi:hypothetical protein
VVERRKPYIAARQLLVARVDPGVVKYEATFFYDIRYGGVKNLRIDVPADLAADIHNNSTGITEKPLDPAPADVAKGYIAWSFAGEGDFSGSAIINLSWERRLENLEVGKSAALTMPQLRPRNVDRAWGQIVLVKAETIDVLPSGTPSGLRSIDAQHDLMPGANVSDGALAFEFQDDWSLAVAATRYQLESVKHTSVERGLVRAVVTRGGQVAVQALYRMRSARQRLAVELPAGVEFDTEPLRIDGRPTPLERGAKDEFFVPLVGRPGDRPFLLELRYALPGGGARVDLPTFKDEPAVQKVYVSVYLPQEMEMLGFHGPWTDEQQGNSQPYWHGNGMRNSDSALVSWVREGVNMAGNPEDSFPVDGKLFVFSTLRPEAGESGGLQLTTLGGKWLQGLIFAAVVAVGLVLIRRPLAVRGAALVVLAIAVLLLGVFLPTLAQQIIGGGIWLALALTVLVWLSLGLVWRARKPRAAGSGGTPQLKPAVPDVRTSPPAENPPTAGPPPTQETPPKPSQEPQQGGDVHE